MPKYGIHHLVMRESIHELKISSDAQDRDVGYLLTHHEDMAMLGAIGPDVFFWAPDYDVVKKLYRLYKNLEEIHDQYEAVVEPLRKIRDAIGEPVKQTLQEALPHSYETVVNLVKELERRSKACKAALSTGLLAGVIEGANLVTDARSLPPPGDPVLPGVHTRSTAQPAGAEMVLVRHAALSPHR